MSRLSAVAALALLSVAVGCSGPEPPSPYVVARVGGGDVRLHDYQAYLERILGEPGTDLDSEVLSKLLDQLLDERLLAHLAVDRGLASSELPGRQAVDRFLRANPVPEPTEDEKEAYYHAHAEDYRRPERVHLRQILVEDRETAEKALAELKAGKDFADVSRRYSQDPSAQHGGDQGELARDDLPPAFVDTIFHLEPGQVSDVVGAEYGFHIFQLIERLPAELVPFDQVEDEIRNRLREEAADRLVASLVEEARGRYTVEVFARNLPFNYQGRYAQHHP